MSGLKNTVKRMWNFGRVFGSKGYMTNKEYRAKQDAKKQATLDKTFQSALMPDEEEIAREERRKAAKRRGSRADTVLTDQDLLG